MDILAAVLVFGGMVFVAWHTVDMRFLWPRREQRLMLDDLLTLESAEEKRNYLHSRHHGRGTKRCACDEYALPQPNGSVRDNDALHSRHRCQPNREVIDA